jgi:DNA-binding NarL/FixJ family response regulator
MNEDPETAADAFRAGVSAYVIKRSAASELMIAIREVLQHHAYVTPLVTKSLMQWILGGQGAEAGTPILTERQREVIQLVADGRSMKDIGRVLGITPRTVAFHKYRMMSQLKVKTTAELVRFAIRRRLI